MIVVRVELHSAITREVTEIARMGIANIGGDSSRGHYACETYRGRTREALQERVRQRRAIVRDYPRLAIHVWHLVARALIAMNYAGAAVAIEQPDLLDAGK